MTLLTNIEYRMKLQSWLEFRSGSSVERTTQAMNNTGSEYFSQSIVYWRWRRLPRSRIAWSVAQLWDRAIAFSKTNAIGDARWCEGMYSDSFRAQFGQLNITKGIFACLFNNTSIYWTDPGILCEPFAISKFSLNFQESFLGLLFSVSKAKNQLFLHFLKK